MIDTTTLPVSDRSVESGAVGSAVDRFAPIDLAMVDRSARLQTRKDRKYLADADAVVRLLEALSADPRTAEVRALDIDGRRWSAYRSVYFDTERFDSYRLAATRRPFRFKLRTRTYVDSGLTVAELKVKSRRGRTVKHRRSIDDPSADILGTVRRFAAGFGESAPYTDRLAPVLANRYNRATLVLPMAGVRLTIDAGYRCVDTGGETVRLDETFILETKTAGAPSEVDRLLWRAGHRPVKISKYATGLAALHPELPANRWNPVLCAHFGRRPAAHRPGLGADPRPRRSGGAR